MNAKLVSTFSDDALGTEDGVGLAQRLRQKEVTQVELFDAAIARLAKVQNILNPITNTCFDSAREIAKSQGQFGVFGGIPSFLKDNTDLGELPTGYGSDAVPVVKAKRDAHLTKQLKSLGIIFIGKSTTPEFGFNCTTEFARRPPTKNPWNTEYSAGGSSGGAAALVASGVVPLAHANDGGGSIRIPAACCGLIGLKPTRTRLISQEKAKKMPVNIVCDGVLTRSVRDTAMFYHGCEQYWVNPKLPKIGYVEGPGRERQKIGIIYDSYLSKTCAETRKNLEATAKTLESQGHILEVIDIPVDESFVADFADYWAFIAFTVARFGAREFGREYAPQKLDGLTLGLAKRFQKRFWRLPSIIYRLRKTKQQFARRLARFDALLSPVVGHLPPKLGELSPVVEFEELFSKMLQFVSFTPINNANGCPAISLPTGVSDSGLPIGVQISAHYGMERKLLELAYELEGLGSFCMLHQQDARHNLV